jgi:hypothetical protein
MQKNFRDFTIGELLDLGLDVEVKKHGLQSIEDGTVITQMFEGTKQSTSRLTANLATVNAWKEKFHVTVYIPTE